MSNKEKSRLINKLWFFREKRILYLIILSLLVFIVEFSMGLNTASILLSIIALILARYWRIIPRVYAESTRRYIIANLLRAGRGLKSESIQFLARLLQVVLVLIIGFSLFVVVYTGIYGFNVFILIPLLALFSILIVVILLPRLLVYSWISQRKTDVEVELPYLVILLRVLSVLKIPIYDVISIIEKSISLPASSREVKFARKIATVKASSLLGSLDTVYANHPSEKISSYVRRVVIAATTHGEFTEAAERVFDAIYGLFESKVASLIGSFTIIVGASLFVYLFLPVIVAAIAPVMGGSLLLVLGVSLTMQVLVFFVLYAVIANLYPTSLVVKPSRRLRITSFISILTPLFLTLYNIFSLLVEREPLSEQLYIAMVMASTLPGFILSELEYRFVKLYDLFVRATSESLSLAATTGENLVSVLERSAVKYGRKITRLTRTIAMGYLSEKLRVSIVARAPSLFHAAFIETLINILRLGATPQMLRLFTSSYERINNLVSRARGFARTLEAIMIGLVAVVGGFIAYIRKVFEYIVGVVESARTGYSIPLILPFTYDPRIYSLLDNLSILSLLFISILIGVVRGGSYTYSHRSFILMLLIYTLAKIVVGMMVI